MEFVGDAIVSTYGDFQRYKQVKELPRDQFKLVHTVKKYKRFEPGGSILRIPSGSNRLVSDSSSVGIVI